MLTIPSDLPAISPFWYIGTPYSKHPKGIHIAFEDACRASAALVEKGYLVYCPIAHSHPIAIHGNIDPYSHDIWLPVDTPFMQMAGGLLIIQMPSWKDSYGLSEEIKNFEKSNKPIKYLQWKEN